MKLSSAIIHYELQRSYPLGPCRYTGTKLSLKRPLLWNGERSAERNRVYILAAPAFPEEYSTSNLFVFCGEAPKIMPRCDYICFTMSQVVEQVLNDLQMIFDRYWEWDDHLEEVCLQGSAQEILECSAPVFENMLVLTDVGFRIVAFTSDSPQEGFCLPPRTTAERQARLKQFYAAKRDEDSPFSIPRDILGFEKLACNFFDNGINIGSLTIHPSRKAIRPQDRALLSHVRMRMAARWRALAPLECSENHLSKLLRQMLAGEHIEKDYLLFALSFTECTDPPAFRCVIIRLPEEWKREHLLYLQRRLSQEPTAAAFFDYQNMFYILQSTGDPSEETEEFVGLEQVLAAIELQAGISDSFEDISLFPYYCAEAAFALEKNHLAESGRMVFFSSCVEDYILENCCGKLKREMLYPAGFRHLIAHDTRGKISYVDTLKTYLDANMNALQAAAKLYICRNTLIARMAYIQAILGLDLDDPDNRLLLLLCIKLYYAQNAGA